MNTKAIAKETVVPIRINTVHIYTDLDTVTKNNVQYHNVLVPDCPSYVQNELRHNNYNRKQSIVRLQDDGRIQWPDHPTKPNGRIHGAIVLLLSSDNKILLVRNGKLWGLPKGARSYKEFLRIKKETDEHYLRTGKILQHDTVTFSESETALENACREVREETGIVLSEDDLTPVTELGSYDRFYAELDYTCDQYNDILEKNGTDHENDELLWASMDQLIRMLKTHRDPYQNKVFNHMTYNFLDNYVNGR